MSEFIDDYCEQMMVIKKRSHSSEASESSKSTVCGDCQKTYCDTKNLARHRKRMHGVITPEPKKGFHCSECDDSFSRYSGIMFHFKEKHPEIVIQEESFDFDSVDDFNNWKETIERETVAKFVVASGFGKKHNSTGTITYLSCHRSGVYISKGTGKREVKEGGSYKIGKFCPARMTITTKGKHVNVKFTSTHVGHDNEHGRFKSTKSEKKLLAAERKARRHEARRAEEELASIRHATAEMKKHMNLKSVNVRKLETRAKVLAVLSLLETCTTHAEVDLIDQMVSQIEPYVYAVRTINTASIVHQIPADDDGEQVEEQRSVYSTNNKPAKRSRK